MTKIGLISDTHGYLDERVFEYFAGCDEIWHAGDIGDQEVMNKLEAFKPVVAVYGNIDGADLRHSYPEDQVFEREEKTIWITHIGGYPPRYNRRVIKQLDTIKPYLFICGHSHIVKVLTDKARLPLIHINPGAAGMQGFHKMRTIMRFDLTPEGVKNLQLIELGKRG
ncbi:metallophosphoesterase family protein [Imperialibacter roseus]|uniref:Phosphoesterase n=1 Tax=Imperialibacter roseus TaxID=1324217 RepID=A0ABZ0ILF3_9BACT|nr:metallophosphoesterase family protein [Imperialibacter roseus]WOK05024.1 metallophosphoesterase family protein [Imperialibacter roseus]|tara:strand:- start:3947 stop:4447 length:501 start_codon:yes stop_codon:yes gene_type:complete